MPEAAPPAAPETPVAPPEASTPPAEGSAPAVEPSAKELSEFARHRRGLQDKARELRQGFAQMKAREKELAERETAREKEITELRARVEKWEKGNPLEHVADPSQTVRDYVEKTGPERRIDQLEKANRDLLEKLSKLEKLPEELTKKEQERQAQQAQAQMSAHEAEERRGFTRALRARGTDFPFVHAEYEDAEIEAFAAEIQAYARKEKRVVTFDDAAKFLNERAKRVYESRSERRKVLAPGDKPGSGTEHPGKKPPPGTGPRADRPPTPPPVRRRFSDAEQEERDKAMLRDAMDKDRLESAKRNGAYKRS